MSERDGTEFSFPELLSAMLHGYWTCGWDSRSPLPSWGGASHVYYDGHWYAMRVWRFYVTIDPYPDRRTQ